MKVVVITHCGDGETDFKILEREGFQHMLEDGWWGDPPASETPASFARFEDRDCATDFAEADVRMLVFPLESLIGGP